MARIKRRPGQHKDESPMEYLRRVVENSGSEYESLWDDMPSVEACLELFELWHAYNTDLWQGILECIAEGDSPAKARAFIRKWKLPKSWSEAVDYAIECRETTAVA